MELFYVVKRVKLDRKGVIKDLILLKVFYFCCFLVDSKKVGESKRYNFMRCLLVVVVVLVIFLLILDFNEFYNKDSRGLFISFIIFSLVIFFNSDENG